MANIPNTGPFNRRVVTKEAVSNIKQIKDELDVLNDDFSKLLFAKDSVNV
jgi:hypothetical protein